MCVECYGEGKFDERIRRLNASQSQNNLKTIHTVRRRTIIASETQCSQFHSIRVVRLSPVISEDQTPTKKIIFLGGVQKNKTEATFVWISTFLQIVIKSAQSSSTVSSISNGIITFFHIW